jgi:DNA-binding transcriptional regulator LsrR (DeoR family)
MDATRADLLAQIAVWYYEDGLDQEAVAQRINRSRSLVSRLLDEARQAGIVEVRIKYPLKTDSACEERLCRTFGLRAAIVLAQPPADHQTLLRRLGDLGARYLQGCLHDGILIGVSWGSCVHAVVRSMPVSPTPRAQVVQMIGAVGHGDPMIDGAELARWLAQKLDAEYRYISAPLLVESELVAEALLRERSIAEVLALSAHVDVAIIGIGTIDPSLSSLLRAGYISEPELSRLQELGAVGDVIAHQLDAQGSVMDVGVNRRVIGLQNLDCLRAIPVVMGVAGGVVKAPAILAALRGRYVNVLVTDSATARDILSLANVSASPQTLALASL